MTPSASRRFTDSPAVRVRVPLSVGLVGPSSSGKTYSMLRLLTGFQRVCGGDIGVIDTEARRALHYADSFQFRHLPFDAPFGPLDYLAAIEHFLANGIRNIGVDSASHEHEGPGGVLEMHEAERQRLAQQWKTSLEAVSMTAWQKPKSERRRLLNSILQMPVNFVFCFRAKEKLKLVTGEKPKPLGWMPIAGEEFVYEMTLNCLLHPGAGGIPSWHPDELGERAIVKLPAQFRPLFAESQPLSEDIGEALARWAEGGAAPIVPEAEERRGVLAEIQRTLLARWADQSDSHKRARLAAVKEAFGVTGWKALEGLSISELRAGLDGLQRPFGGRTREEDFEEEARQREAAEAEREADEERAAIQSA